MSRRNGGSQHRPGSGNLRVRIFNCHHADPGKTIRTELSATLLSGYRSTDRYLGDLDGINIHDENPQSEMRHQFYVWKNLPQDLDRVGFEHYRRVFFVDVWTNAVLKRFSHDLLDLRIGFNQDFSSAFLPVPRSVFDIYWSMRERFGPSDVAAFRSCLGNFDIVMTKSADPKNMRVQWESCLPNEIWPLMMQLAREIRFGRRAGSLDRLNISWPSYNNMYIIRTELFVEYMEFYFDTIAAIHRKMEPPSRLWRHCAERLFNMYVCAKRTELPARTATPAAG